MSAPVYRFSDFHLDPAARELRRDGRPLVLPRRMFDALVHLVDNRDRAIGRETLIAELWGGADVADIQLTQLIMRLRRALGDDSRHQALIRTVPGFGYRWSGVTEVIRSSAPAEAPVEFGEVIAVLPLDVHSPGDMDATWIRLGAMALIAERLREAGLPVPPTDSVIAALDNLSERPGPGRDAALREILSAETLVHGTASLEPDGWKTVLTATSVEGDMRVAEATASQAMLAVRHATDLLLSALGQPMPASESEDPDLREHLQRVQAALLANELDAARRLLKATRLDTHADPRLRFELAWVELRSGNYPAAEGILKSLLDNPRTESLPLLHTQVLTTLGWIRITDRDREDWHGAERYFNAAVAVLDGRGWSSELGLALASRGATRIFLDRPAAAARDLGAARLQLEAVGNRLALTRINNYLGHLEMLHNRVTTAVGYFQAAVRIAEAFGAIDHLRSNFNALFHAQCRLLRYADALVTSERLWRLRRRVSSPALRAEMGGQRAWALLALGLHGDVEQVLDASFEDTTDPHHAQSRYLYLARAELAWRRRRFEAAIEASAHALSIWPAEASSDSDLRAYAALLQQRASFAAGRSHRLVERYFQALTAPTTEDVRAYRAVAQAERALGRRKYREAEADFEAAVAHAQTHGVPDTIAMVAWSYAGYLLDRGRTAEASALAGWVAPWAAHDYRCAVLQAAAYRANHQTQAWTRALQQAQRLCGERDLSADVSH